MMKIKWSGSAMLGLIGIGVLAVGGLLGWAGRGVLLYHGNVATVGTYYDWRTACPSAQDKANTCQIVQDVLDAKSHGEVARIAILQDGGKLVMGVTMPYNVLLQAGLGVTIGTAPQKIYQYRTCNTVGCLVVIPYDQAFSDSLRKAKDAHFVFTGLDNKGVQIPLSLKGFNDASDAFAREEAKRSSWFWRMWS